ncbi:MAG: hypothetical protein JXQ69_00990 [Paludibacteraceae bacterium]|nr:hypothetical protein [Paludibacteraceae bacterium]
MRINTPIILIILTLILFSCSTNRNSYIYPFEYLKWINTHNTKLSKDTIIGDYDFLFQYKPLNYLVLSDLNSINEVKSAMFDSVLQEYKGVQYYLLRIKPLEQFADNKYLLNKETVFDKEIEYFAFHMKQDLKLVEANDTLPCMMFNYDRVYRNAPYYTFLLGFEQKEVAVLTDKTLLFNDKKIGVGLISIIISKDSLNQEPKIKFKK